MNINTVDQKINFKNLYEKNITNISIEEESNFKNFSYKNWSHAFDYLIPLKIYNSNTIKLLNYIINFKHSEFLKGMGPGGILTKKNTGIMVNNTNDYFIFFYIFYKQWPCSKDGLSIDPPSIQYVVNYIKRSLSTAIKEFLKANETIEKIQFKDLDHPDTILTFEKYYLEILYGFFKDENLSKKFNEEQINEVIGQDPKNQFILNAMEVFREEVLKVEKERKKSIDSLVHEREIEFEKIREKYNNKINEAMELYENNIKDIQNQIQELMKQNSI